jgi:hypothetical protein
MSPWLRFFHSRSSRILSPISIAARYASAPRLVNAAARQEAGLLESGTAT